MMAAPTSVPDDRPAAAGEAPAADDHRGDDVELQTHGHRRIAHRELRELQHSGAAGQGRGRGVDRDLPPLYGHTAQARRPLVRADGEELAPESRVAQSTADDHERQRNDYHQIPSGATLPLPTWVVRSRSLSHVIGASTLCSSARPFAAPRTRSIIPRVTMKGTTLEPRHEDRR